MTRQEVKQFIQSGAELLNLPFDTGRISEFNSDRYHSYPFIFLETINSTTTLNNSLPTDTWTIRIHIASKDTTDSVQSQYEELIDNADIVGQKLVKRYNDILQYHNLVSISNITRTPFIKKHADCLTGIILNFILKVQDTSGCD